ncbi:carbon monoxide dehydrogenase subunit G [Bacillus mesophilus]|uniref:Carbon monoxide dehydrogenase subunit G n=1 Tax=Bacillus mesophilus TaxID=1808955 RepID=A0A6M0QCS4_9BACI|nr:carbon monoxide dehydrogenase subunit G [Bacillus mesophilus]MBM7663490.1 carbon monoxide dehydrogenase subunit G [Bacillus mesophilus]NEY74161.1 carbon monoxide dehydrogenase subunit G [Bacillus mesophilus]
MNGNGSILLESSLENTWDGLFDPDILEKCMMGCKKLTHIDKNTYLAELKIGVPPVSGKYESHIVTEEVEKFKTYRLIIKAEGDSGGVEATSLINLTKETDEKTLLSYSFEAEVNGKASKVGDRILKGVGKLLIQDFFKKFGKELKKAYTI